MHLIKHSIIPVYNRITSLITGISGNKKLIHQSADNQKKKIIGLVMPQLTRGVDSQILDGFEKTVRDRGYLLMCNSSDIKLEEEKACIERMIHYGVKSIAVYSFVNPDTSAFYKDCIAKGVDFMFLDVMSMDIQGSMVTSDNYGGGYAAAQHLIQRGFKNTVFISLKNNKVSSIYQRLQGYLQASKDFGGNLLSNESLGLSIQHDDSFGRYHFIIADLEDIINNYKDDIPIGIFAANDDCAVDCIRILDQLSVNIGKDIAIVGFDNNPETANTNPPLTTVAQNGFLIGQNAAEIMIKKAEGQDHNTVLLSIPTQLIIRKSCGE